MAEARRTRDVAHGNRVTYSPKVFIPLTMLCRDRCGYCTFAQPPAAVGPIDGNGWGRSTHLAPQPAREGEKRSQTGRI